MNVLYRTYIAFFILLLGALTGCSDGERAAEDRIEREKTALLTTIDSLNEVMQQRVDQWESDFEKASPERRKELAEDMAYFQELQAELLTERDDLRVAIADDWHYFRGELEKNLMRIRDSVQQRQ